MKAIGIGFLAAGLITTGATAQTWPDKPIRLVLSQPAGSGPDNVVFSATPLRGSWVNRSS
jgi:tripartite-type tricarboxylate transporter receptor subunit TctC